MRLKQINLAGFKSFVDSTKIPFEQQMTAIVGPNGCGKSNIIDAVRWVLGESSAKNLRGDTMTDVIFNGANSRKPVGQASVELIFDNTQGRLKGSMADRNQVSIRRVVNRDSTNTYFLNSAKCRRKDITDIFLGTGLGPRSYAIIEQGTISRLIESKPQDLRIFIEEAAGISKYKERRRETETRIRHTRENLARLFDIRSELTLQVDKLHQQAEAAKRFKTLKTTERKYKAELAVFRWQQFKGKSDVIMLEIEQSQTQISQLQLNEKHSDISLFQLKQKNTIEAGSLKELQESKLELTQSIAKTEQSIKYTQQENSKLSNELKLNEQQYSHLLVAAKQTSSEQQQVNQLLSLELPKLSQVEESITTTKTDLSALMNKQQACQQHWNEFNDAQRQIVQENSAIEIEVSKLRSTLDSSTERKSEIEQLILENTQAQSSFNLDEVDKTQLTENESLNKLNVEVNHIQQQIDECEDEQTVQTKFLAQQQGIEQALQQNLAQLKSTSVLQPDWLSKQSQWLDKHNITVNGFYHQKITVENKWQLACEHVLSTNLQAQVVDTFPEDSSLATMFLVKDKTVNIEVQKGTLAEKVQGDSAFTSMLNQIYLADSLTKAYELLASLKDHQSVICADGTWLGHHFLRKGEVEASEQVLQRTGNINDLENKLLAVENRIQQSTKQENTTKQRLALLKLQKAEVSAEQIIKQRLCQQLNQDKVLKEHDQQLHLKQNKLLVQQLMTIEPQIIQQQLSYAKLVEQHNQAREVNFSTKQNEQLVKERDQVQHRLQYCQTLIQKLHDERHQISLKVEHSKHKKNQIDESIVKNTDLSNSLQNTILLVKQQLIESEVPLAYNKQSLQNWLSEISLVDKKLIDINQHQSNAAENIKEFEKAKQNTLKQIEQLKEKINKQNLEAQNYNLRAESALEQLKEMQQNVAEVQANTTEEVKEGIWQAHIIRLAKDINRLGAINLAAINEYESQVERKNYLDQQNDDLTQAISTLESAIAKIDKESRQKFQVTFERVNSDLKTLFPKVFGGGSAYLELTGEDLLDTGVTIMARPPGKKNSTIHLLSGGEKALTALSLVFAIFRLNPAPFCMLDEVDAPLDDANVERFCNLVREMSQTVQFIYISHNKIAMEMASHLTGVTMFEPGVSRMVAVDIDEAIAMAEN